MARFHEKRWEIAGVLFTVAVGTLLHFTYAWSGGNRIVAVFSAVNESIWEHGKLLAVPWILWSVVEALALRGSGLPVLSARAAGLLVGMAAIPTLYYTYTGIVGQHFLAADLAVFLLAILLAMAVSLCLLHCRALSQPLWQIVGGLVLAGVMILLAYWTMVPPQLPLFWEM